MLFPISDDDKDVTTTAWVTWTILAINIGVFAYQLSNPDFTYAWAATSAEITKGVDIAETVQVTVPGFDIGGAEQAPEQIVEIPHRPGPPLLWLTLFSSMFMHAGFGHIASNMLYLWIFGNNIEHRFGHFVFFVFYALSGLAGSFAQIAISPESLIPMMGASAAIAGILGAYLVLYPRNRVNAVILYFIVSVPAVLVLGLWGASQFISGYGAIASSSATTGGVAYMAHIGGFLMGVATGLLYRFMIPVEPDSELKRQYDRDPQTRNIW